VPVTKSRRRKKATFSIFLLTERKIDREKDRPLQRAKEVPKALERKGRGAL